MQLLSEAILFAVEAHKNQFRKYDNSAYIKHPLAVMGMMTEFTQNPKILAACVLHDTVEDCKDVTIEVIHERFGEEVAGFVYYSTEKSQKSDGNRGVRKEIDRRHYAKGPYVSQDIKGLDMIENIPSIVLFNKEFSITYMDEKIQLLGVLEKCNPIIKCRALSLISTCLELAR